MRLLITGSRDWVDEYVVYAALAEWRNKARDGEMVMIVHGECPTGADWYAEQWGRNSTDPDVQVERHPAQWEMFGKKAGPIRNSEMVGLGADVCLAFPLPQSRGTFHCMREAEAADIPVVVYKPATVHAVPLGSDAITPCCRRIPFDLPTWDRMTMDSTLVTCGRGQA